MPLGIVNAKTSKMFRKECSGCFLFSNGAVIWIEKYPERTPEEICCTYLHGKSASEESKAAKDKAIVPGTEEVVQMIINVEAQNDFYPGYPIVKRGIY